MYFKMCIIDIIIILSDIDNNVASIIALEPDTVELFGVSQNRRAIMRSGDLGVTWSSMEPERYLDLSSKGYLMEMSRVPFVEVSDVPDIVMATEGNNAFFEWGGKFLSLRII